MEIKMITTILLMLFFAREAGLGNFWHHEVKPYLAQQVEKEYQA